MKCVTLLTSSEMVHNSLHSGHRCVLHCTLYSKQGTCSLHVLWTGRSLQQIHASHLEPSSSGAQQKELRKDPNHYLPQYNHCFLDIFLTIFCGRTGDVGIKASAGECFVSIFWQACAVWHLQIQAVRPSLMGKFHETLAPAVTNKNWKKRQVTCTGLVHRHSICLPWPGKVKEQFLHFIFYLLF